MSLLSKLKDLQPWEHLASHRFENGDKVKLLALGVIVLLVIKVVVQVRKSCFDSCFYKTKQRQRLYTTPSFIHWLQSLVLRWLKYSNHTLSQPRRVSTERR